MSVIYSDLDALAEYVRAWKLDANNKKTKSEHLQQQGKSNNGVNIDNVGLNII